MTELIYLFISSFIGFSTLELEALLMAILMLVTICRVAPIQMIHVYYTRIAF